MGVVLLLDGCIMSAEERISSLQLGIRLQRIPWGNGYGLGYYGLIIKKEWKKNLGLVNVKRSSLIVV